MKDFNSYIGNLDCSDLKRIFQEKGKLHIYRKKDFFTRQNEVPHFAGWVKSGTFQYICIDEKGNEHIVGYAFSNEFVCDYSSFLKQSASLVNIQAITECTVYELSSLDITHYWETNMETQRLGRIVAESLYEMAYKRLLEFYCDTPEIRYLKLMKRCPELKEALPLKNIASFLGVTPETVSHIRKKNLLKMKS